MFLIIYNSFHILNEIKIKSFLLIYFFYLFFLRCWAMNLQPSHIVIWVKLILSKSVYTMKDYGADQYMLKEDFNVRPDWGKTLQLIKSLSFSLGSEQAICIPMMVSFVVVVQILLHEDHFGLWFCLQNIYFYIFSKFSIVTGIEYIDSLIF